MEKAERDAILRQGIVLPETPRHRRERAALEEDLRSNPSRGKPLRLRLRNFLPKADSYLAAARGPLHYMLRLHDIERRLEEHGDALRAAWHALALECDGDASRFRRRWTAEARRMDFTEVNGLIERHNRWYPVESEIAMDPRTGDYALVNGQDYRRSPLDEAWVLERFPSELGVALSVHATRET
jgi:hypothetical protein